MQWYESKSAHSKTILFHCGESLQFKNKKKKFVSLYIRWQNLNTFLKKGKNTGFAHDRG